MIYRKSLGRSPVCSGGQRRPDGQDIAPGNRFSLVLEIKPGPGVHVYAPGAKGYRAIALTLAPLPNIPYGTAPPKSPPLRHAEGRSREGLRGWRGPACP